MTHNEFTPHAFITLSNCGGIEIMINRSNDGVYYRFNYGQDNLDKEEIFEAEIDYRYDSEEIIEDAESMAYFQHGTNKYSLNDAMRIN